METEKLLGYCLLFFLSVLCSSCLGLMVYHATNGNWIWTTVMFGCVLVNAKNAVSTFRTLGN